MNNSSPMDHSAAGGNRIAAALRAMPEQRAPEGAWKGVLDRYGGEQRRQNRRRRYWGGGLAVAASLAVAVVGLRLGAGMFSGAPAIPVASNPGPEGVSALESAQLDEAEGPVALDFGEQLEQMDMDALIAFSQFQEERLRALPMVDMASPGQIVEVGSFGLTTEIEDQIALLDEGLIPASLKTSDRAFPRRLLRERALLMEDLFDLRRAEAAQAGYMYADF